MLLLLLLILFSHIILSIHIIHTPCHTLLLLLFYTRYADDTAPYYAFTLVIYSLLWWCCHTCHTLLLLLLLLEEDSYYPPCHTLLRFYIIIDIYYYALIRYYCLHTCHYDIHERNDMKRPEARYARYAIDIKLICSRGRCEHLFTKDMFYDIITLLLLPLRYCCHYWWWDDAITRVIIATDPRYYYYAMLNQICDICYYDDDERYVNSIYIYYAICLYIIIHIYVHRLIYIIYSIIYHSHILYYICEHHICLWAWVRWDIIMRKRCLLYAYYYRLQPPLLWRRYIIKEALHISRAI